VRYRALSVRPREAARPRHGKAGQKTMNAARQRSSGFSKPHAGFALAGYFMKPAV
jgi:hypothetical protein